MTIDGVSVTLIDKDIPHFEAGVQYQLVLNYNKTEGKYHLPGAVSGAFTPTISDAIRCV
jgi:hypothetical protein